MNPFSSHSLAQALRDGTVLPVMQLFLCLAFVLLELFSWAVNTSAWTAPQHSSEVGGMILVIKIAGLIAAWFANGGGRGVDFISRFIALSFPTRMRSIATLILLWLPVVCVVAFLNGLGVVSNSARAANFVFAYSFVGFNVLHYWFLCGVLRKVRETTRGARGIE
jgi:hypothetical protein